MVLPTTRRGSINKSYSSSSSRSLISLPRFIIATAFIIVVLLFIFKVDSLASRIKTIAGHNLEPTPWHLFPPKDFKEESRYSVASKIIQCSYLSCGSIATTSTTPMKVRLMSKHRPKKNCPNFFKYIHYDLQPWADTKISLAHVTQAKKFAAFRLVILDGKLYVDFYYACVQSRAMFTVWGVLQLLKRYPGQVPDVDLMFECMDKPSINRTQHSEMPLPLFRYCTTPDHFDIPFPDWSYWGWAETNIRNWDKEFKSIKRGSKATSWEDKIPLAYWKGNPHVGSPLREALLQCNDTNIWGAQILIQDWLTEVKRGFKSSSLAKQCNHRYKIYAEGFAWSVSLKYIMACGSLPLIISPHYEDFFSRGLIPKKNYWPIPRIDLCENIKAAVDWGNANSSEAEAIGKRAQNLMGSLRMDRIYDYMYHLITEYSKLLDFTPTRPTSALEMCTDSVVCFADDKQKQFLERSATVASSMPPCTLPTPDDKLLKTWKEKKHPIMNNNWEALQENNQPQHETAWLNQ